MKQVFAETIGSAKIVVVKQDDGAYAGTVWGGSAPSEIVPGDDLDRLIAQLRNIAGRLHPDYFGLDGATKRFLSFFPGGFEDPGYLARERSYKVRARDSLVAAAPVGAALDADHDVSVACRKALATNLLSPFESARLNEVLGSPEGPAFVRAAAAFSVEPLQEHIGAMERATAPHGTASWALLTYLPFLWNPEGQMFLKPNATKDFAIRTGHQFSRDYEAALRLEVYLSLLDLAATTATQIRDLIPRDRIDVQSFIWVVGSYTDADREAA